ncbi:cell division protein ZipA C-terminal FtsZ-binding domain-containing protein [Psychrobacter arenosus]|uniref:cell division protein ZipA C-terminal FtsZ-binding domain-containing protein n=1 Tax=Psychrobacter arenosus TaxID=256326 RepID=UPI001918E699|nr:cell division protein ZipA C-terminal FtsZ-binding domain-containing protein [Psychrobacter arenosus]
MTTIQFILIVSAALIILAGLFMVIRSLKRQRSGTAAREVEYDKNGIPIIPRHERNLVDEPDLDDTIAGETTIAPDRSHLNAVMEEDSAHDHYAETTYQPEQGAYHSSEEPSSPEYSDWQTEQRRADDHEFSHIASELDGEPATERDAFSTLVSATENLMPVIDTAEEPSFTDNSPVLDKHLLAAADQDQNSPLNNATDNINITLLPRENIDHPPSVIIRGEQLLKIVDKYGLKYGAMNMFHRYENKDGTGILWFSMMGITHDGIAPFDLNTMPQTGFSGLVMFLSLPHPKALQGFDSMMSIAGLVSREINAVVMDENNQPITQDLKARLRTEVQEYRAPSR